MDWIKQQWELLVLSRLKWDMCAITPHDFVDLLLTRLHVDQPQCRVNINNRRDRTRRIAHGYIAMCALGKYLSNDHFKTDSVVPVLLT